MGCSLGRYLSVFLCYHGCEVEQTLIVSRRAKGGGCGDLNFFFFFSAQLLRFHNGKLPVVKAVELLQCYARETKTHANRSEGGRRGGCVTECVELGHLSVSLEAKSFT